MADKAKVFGKTKIIDTGSVTKIQVAGNDLLTIDHATGNINLLTGATLSSDLIYVSATTGVSEKFYVEGNSRLKGQTYHDGVLRVIEQAANTNPSGGSEVLIYMKGDKLVIAYDHSGTGKYRTLDLTSTDATWAYSTSAP